MNPNVPYQLTRDSIESNRLNSQHEILLRAVGFYIHPTIAKGLGENARVADIGTGTGIWLVDVAKELPKSCQLVGFDLSDDQYPKDKSTLPENIDLHVADATKGFPEAFRNSFDVVHLRLLVAGLNADDWPRVMRNAIDLLKPGGALQWVEIHTYQASKVLAGSPTSSTKFTTATLKHLFEHFPRLAGGYGNLMKTFESADLENKDEFVVSTDRLIELRRPITEQLTFVWSSLVKAAAASGNPFMSEEDLNRRVTETNKEMDSGAYVRADISVCIGFKAR